MRNRLRGIAAEAGSSIVETLLGLTLLALVAGVGAQLFVFAQARVVAVAAAQDGARAAADQGSPAGLAQAQQVLAAGGGAANGLTASVTDDGATVTATVSGSAPDLLPLGFLMPQIDITASTPVEQYPADEQNAAP